MAWFISSRSFSDIESIFKNLAISDFVSNISFQEYLFMLLRIADVTEYAINFPPS